LKRMHAEEEFLLETSGRLPYWIDFYDSRLTERVLIEFSKSIDRMQGHITKLAIVGCSSRDRRRLLQLAKKAGVEFLIPLRFFSDPEEAKTWLVSESK
jgi:hypothetical protein